MTVSSATFASFALVACTLVACSSPSTTSDSGGGDATDPGSVDLPAQESIEASPSPGAPGTTGTPAGNGSTPSADVAQPREYRLPAWQLQDVQPKSSRYQQTYGLEAFRGKTLVVVLLEGYCPYCRSNSLVAEQLQKELDAEKLDVQIVVLGDANASEFASRVSMPIFRDEDGQAWEAMRKDASKHDTFVFAPNGERSFFWLGSYQGDATRWRSEVGTAARQVARRR